MVSPSIPYTIFDFIFKPPSMSRNNPEFSEHFGTRIFEKIFVYVKTVYHDVQKN